MDDHDLEKLAAVIRQVFGQPRLRITRRTVASDVPGWDSLNHLFLMMEIEARFGVSVSADELAALPHIGALHDMILAKRSPAAR